MSFHFITEISLYLMQNHKKQFIQYVYIDSLNKFNFKLVWPYEVKHFFTRSLLIQITKESNNVCGALSCFLKMNNILIQRFKVDSL